jgi:hypothetical protein
MVDDLLARLRNAGLTISRNGDHLVVAPRHQLTDDLRAAIRERKLELLAALAAEQRPSLTSDIVARILKMAKRHGFSPEELAMEISQAAADPSKELLWIEHDEAYFGNGESVNVRH